MEFATGSGRILQAPVEDAGGVASCALSIAVAFVQRQPSWHTKTQAANTRAFPGRARRTWGPVCVALTCLVTSYTAWATQPPEPTPAAAQDASETPKVPGATLRHFALKIDGQTLQLDLQSMDIDAQTIESDAKRKTFRGNVRLQLQLSRAPVREGKPDAGSALGTTAGGPTLILQADAVDLTQPPLHVNVRPGGGCSVTLQDPSGRQLWKLTGAKCSLQAVGPPAEIQAQ